MFFRHENVVHANVSLKLLPATKMKVLKEWLKVSNWLAAG